MYQLTQNLKTYKAVSARRRMGAAANLSTVPLRTQPRGGRRGREKGTELAARMGVGDPGWGDERLGPRATGG